MTLNDIDDALGKKRNVSLQLDLDHKKSNLLALAHF